MLGCVARGGNGGGQSWLRQRGALFLDRECEELRGRLPAVRRRPRQSQYTGVRMAGLVNLSAGRRGASPGRGSRWRRECVSTTVLCWTWREPHGPWKQPTSNFLSLLFQAGLLHRCSSTSPPSTLPGVGAGANGARRHRPAQIRVVAWHLRSLRDERAPSCQCTPERPWKSTLQLKAVYNALPWKQKQQLARKRCDSRLQSEQ